MVYILALGLGAVILASIRAIVPIASVVASVCPAGTASIVSVGVPTPVPVVAAAT